MNAASFVTRRAPPHDPLTLYLSRHDGWRALAAPWSVKLADPAAAQSITLAPAVEAAPVLLGPFGTLGGRLTPAYAARAGDALYLLDRQGRRLLWFDRCACGFVEMPCLWASASDARAMEEQAALAVDDRFIALAGRHGGTGKAVVLDRFTLAAVAVIAGGFTPSSLTLIQGGLALSDAASGTLLVFDYDGRARQQVANVGPALTLTRLAGGRVLAVTAQRALLVDLAGQGATAALTFAEAAALAPGLPFGIDGAGHIVAGAFCIPPKAATVFGSDGAALAAPPVPHATVPMVPAGRYVSAALDSGIHDCRWHCVGLELDVPAGCRVTARTRTAQADLPPELVAVAELPGWSLPQTFSAQQAGRQEFLVTSPPGRWLWLELELAGDGAAAPAIASIAISFPRISLSRYLPAGLSPDPVSEEFTGRFLASFDTGFRAIEARIDNGHRLYDPGAVPAALLDWLAGWVGLKFQRHMAVAEKRRLLGRLPQLFASRGTVAGLEAVLATLLDWPDACDARPPACAPPCTPPRPAAARPRFILEHWRLRRWLHLGRGRLGATSRLWGETILRRSRLGAGHRLGSTRLAVERDPFRDPFHAHAHRFSVFLPAAMAPDALARARIEAQIRSETPAHASPDVHWVEPNMRLGIQSMLGFDTVIGRKARGGSSQHTLGRMELQAEGSASGVSLTPATALGITTQFATGQGRVT